MSETNWLLALPGLAALIAVMVKTYTEAKSASHKQREEDAAVMLTQARIAAQDSVTIRFRELSDEQAKQLGVLLDRITSLTSRVVVLEQENAALRNQNGLLLSEVARVTQELKALRASRSASSE